MSDRFTPNELQALNACFEDALYFKSMLLQISELPECGLLINGFISEASMFVIESYDCLIKILPELKPLFDSLSIERIRQSRHRAKLLESRKNINDDLNSLNNINTEQIQKFQTHNEGLFFKLKNLIQSDLGITKYKGHFITTTHSIIFGAGSNVEMKAEYLYNMGEVIGTYLQTLIEVAGIEKIKNDIKYVSQRYEYQTLDIKSKNLFKRSKFEGDNKEFSSALIIIMVRLNYTKYITPQFFQDNSDSLMRVKFINTYHAYKSLHKIQSLVMKNNPSNIEKYFFKEIFANAEARWLLKQASLRNLLTHYLLDENQIRRMPNKFTRENAIKILVVYQKVC